MLRRFKSALSFAALVLVLGLATACGGGDTQEQQEQGQQGQGNAAPTGGPARDDIIIGLPADISNLDPHNTASASDFRMFELIFSNLVRNSPDGFIPSVAVSWERAEDGLSYTFNLRDDVYFHNGDLMTAGDVVFTFNRAMESPFVGAPLISIANVEAIGDFQVRFNLHHQFAPFIASIASIWIVSESIVEAMGDDFSRNPIGTGPYKFVEHQPGRSVHLTRFDEYFGGPAYIRDVTYMIVLSPATASIAVEAGDIDLSISVPPGDIARLEATPGRTATHFETNSLNFMTINLHMEPFDNPLVREAIARVVDRQGLITMVAEGLGTPAQSFLNELTFGYHPDVAPFERDVTRARELMAEAGFPNGFSTTIATIGDGVFEGWSQVIQANLAEIGITANIELLDQAVFIGNLFSFNYHIGLLSVALPGQDANAWDALFTSEGGMNMTGDNDPEIDQWFARARVATDPAARLEYYRLIAQRVNDTAAFIPLYFTNMAYVHHANLEMGFIGPTGNFRVDVIRWVD